MNAVTLMSDPKVAAIPVAECGEPLADVRAGGRLLVGAFRHADDGAYAHLRQGVLDRLLTAQARLPADLRLLYVEGYRPPALQRRYFDSYQRQLREMHPQLPADRLREAASRYVSPPEIAPHSAGAAVDLTLATADGREVDMGTPVNSNPEESDGACYTAAPNIPASARAHRDVLSAALSSAGLVNYPTEWWHWSYGDRYWALATAAPRARYGPVAL